MKFTCYMLATLCTDGGWLALCFVMGGVAGWLAANDWMFSLLALVPLASMIVARRLNGGKCPLPKWRTKLLRKAVEA